MVWTKTNIVLVFANPPYKPDLVLFDNLVFPKLKIALNVFILNYMTISEE